MTTAKFQIIDQQTGESRGIYNTLGEAQDRVTALSLQYYDIWHGDNLVEYREPGSEVRR